MPQGLRGRVALFGAGVVCCSGLVGCMNSPAAKGPPPVSKAKNGVVTPAGAKTTVPDIRPVGGSGIGNTGGFQPGVAPAGGYPPAGYQNTGPNPNNFGSISGQTTPGIVGPGAPLPGGPTIPSVAPAPSNYPPAGSAIPPGYGSSNAGALPTTARAAAPTAPGSQFRAPTPMLAELQPPPPPGGIVSPADSAPPTAPLGYYPPLAPAPPNAPR